jgi:hypothetical protein
LQSFQADDAAPSAAAVPSVLDTASEVSNCFFSFCFAFHLSQANDAAPSAAAAPSVLDTASEVSNCFLSFLHFISFHFISFHFISLRPTTLLQLKSFCQTLLMSKMLQPALQQSFSQTPPRSTLLLTRLQRSAIVSLVFVLHFISLRPTTMP